MISVKEIRERFPNPVVADGGPILPVEYCVGGAFCLAQDENANPFPSSNELAAWLLKDNRMLEPRKAQAYAAIITTQNDKGNFDAAWDALEEALTYRGEGIHTV